LSETKSFFLVISASQVKRKAGNYVMQGRDVDEMLQTAGRRKSGIQGRNRLIFS